MDIRPSRLRGAFATLAAPRRFDLLVLMLGGGDRSVSQLAAAVGLSQSCTSRHLQALAAAGLVKGARDGKRVVFRVAPHDDAARAVLASIASGAAGPPGPIAGDAAAEPVRPRRRAGVGDGGRAGRSRTKLLESAVRIESAVEFEPLMADGGTDEPAPDLRPDPESGRNSEPETAPAWRRSDLEDFLL